MLVPTFSTRDPSLEAARWLGSRDGEISRAEVLLKLGEPQLAGDEHSLFVYRWHDTRALGFLCAGGYYAADCIGLSVEREFDLVLRFDPDGALAASEIASGLEMGDASGTACTKSGICVTGARGRVGSEPFSAIPLPDAERADEWSHLVFERAADPRAGAAPEGRCLLAILPESAGIASVFVDGQLAGVASRDGWLRVLVEPGSHRIAILDPLVPQIPVTPVSTSLACRSGERVFVTQERAGFLGAYGITLKVGASLAPDPTAVRARRYLSTWAGPR